MQCVDHTKVASRAIRTAQVLLAQVRQTPAEKNEDKGSYEISLEAL